MEEMGWMLPRLTLGVGCAENGCWGVFFPTSASKPHPGPAGGGTDRGGGIWAKEWMERREILSNWERIPIRTQGRRCTWQVKISDLSNQAKSGL